MQFILLGSIESNFNLVPSNADIQVDFFIFGGVSKVWMPAHSAKV